MIGVQKLNNMRNNNGYCTLTFIIKNYFYRKFIEKQYSELQSENKYNKYKNPKQTRKLTCYEISSDFSSTPSKPNRTELTCTSLGCIRLATNPFVVSVGEPVKCHKIVISAVKSHFTSSNKVKNKLREQNFLMLHEKISLKH